MNNHNIETILKELAILNGERLNMISRAAATGTIYFGESRRYALHLQIPFRFVHNYEIILANFDIFEPTAEMEESPDFDWEAHNNMGWDSPGNNRYDEIAKTMLDKEDFIVSSAEVNKLCDLKIFFTNGCVLETFSNASTDDLEFWRFFERSNKEKNHLVIIRSGIEVLED